MYGYIRKTHHNLFEAICAPTERFYHFVFFVSDTTAIFENINNDATGLPFAYDNNNNSNNIITVVCMLPAAGIVMETRKIPSSVTVCVGREGGRQDEGLRPGVFFQKCATPLGQVGGVRAFPSVHLLL